MNSIILSFLLFSAIAYAANVPSAASDESEGSTESRCHYEMDGEDDLPPVQCNFDNGFACHTVIKEYADSPNLKITRNCIPKEDCETDDDYTNTSKCHDTEDGGRHCHFCCTTSLCNDSNGMPASSVEESDGIRA